MTIAELMHPLLNSKGKSGSVTDFSHLWRQIQETKSIKIAHQLFGADISEEFALAALTVRECTQFFESCRDQGKAIQTDAYWLVDVWGRIEAIKALAEEFAKMLDSGQPTGFTAGSFKARAGALMLACQQLAVLIGSRALIGSTAHTDSSNMSGIPNGIVDLSKRLQEVASRSRSSIEAHISDL